MSWLRNSGTMWLTLLGLTISSMSAVKIDHAVNGTVELKSASRVEYRAPAAAFLQQVHIAEGDLVDTGTEIAQLNIPDLDSRILQEEAKLREVEAELRLLETGSRSEEIVGQHQLVSLLAKDVEQRERDVAAARRASQARIAGLDKQKAQSQAEFDFANATLARQKRLQEIGATSEAELEAAERDIEVAQARMGQFEAEKTMVAEQGTAVADQLLGRARKELTEARAKLVLLEAGARSEEVAAATARRTATVERLYYLRQLAQQLKLSATSKGVVSTADLSDLVGTYLREGDLICTVEDPTFMVVDILVTEDDASRVQLGQSVRFKLRGLPFQVFTGRVDKISIAVTDNEEDRQSTVKGTQRMMVLRASISDGPDNLRPGMTGYAKISLGRASLSSIALDHVARFVRREFWW